MSAMPSGSNEPVRPLPKGMAVASLVLGILGVLTAFFLLGGLLGLVAVILGVVALGKIKRGQADGRGLAIGGIVTGALALLLAIVLAATVGAFFARNAEEFSNFNDCVQAAGNDRAAREACEEDFSRQITP